MIREPQVVGDLLDLALVRTPDRVAIKLRDGSDQRTYRELEERSTRLANSLLDLGLMPGDRIAAWMEDRIEYVELYLAAAKAGLVVAPINARFVEAEAEYQLEDAGASALVWTPGLAERVKGLRLPPRDMAQIAVGDAGAAHAFEALVDAGDGRTPSGTSPEDLYILGYTSGTTGRPKGAMLTHRAVTAVGRQNAISYRLSGHTVMGLTGSMSFVSVVPAHVLCLLAAGGTLVMMGQYDVPQLLQTIERERITFTYVPSPLLGDFAQAVCERPERVRSLHSVLHSASRASAQTLRAVHAAIGDRLVEGWGMTELCGGLATATTPDDFLEMERDIFVTAGRAASGTAVRVVDAQGAEVAHDGETIGELIIRSPALMSGYWNRPEATRAALRDGWFYTGDLGSIDDAGYVSVSARRTDLIISGGMNVYPREVEQCILELDGVQDVAVVGIDHERWGQAVAAAVVLSPAAAITEEDVVSHCRARLASFKKPNRVFFLHELPRTAGLKVARAQLRDQLAQTPA